MNNVAILLNYADWRNVKKLALQFSENSFFSHIVIVDNASPDDSVVNLEDLESERIILIKEKENRGFAAGNNAGIKYALDFLNPKYIICIGADIIVENSVLEKAYSVMEKNQNIGLISPCMLNWKLEIDPDFAWQFQTYKQCLSYMFYLLRKKNKYKKYTKIDYTKELVYTDVVRGSFMFFRANVLKECQMFDEHTFLFYEENIICKKIKNLKYDVAVLANETYIHNHVLVDKRNRMKFKASLKSAYYYLCNYMQINFLQKMIYKFLSFFSILEYTIFSRFKKRKKK